MSPTMKSLKWDHLTIDPKVQRNLDTGWVKGTLAKDGFRRDAIGVPVVSLRADGTLHLIDGQHRRALALETGLGSEEVECQVHEGLTRAQEAAMFRLLNYRRSVLILDKFMVRIVEGDPAAVAINDVLTKHGWVVATGKSDGRFAAISAIEKIYEGARIREPGQREVIDLVISMITSAWGHKPTGVRAEIVHGLGLVLLRHERDLDIAKVINEMAQRPGGPYGLVGNAKSLQNYRGGRVVDAMADIIIEMHNKSKRTNRLPDWRAQV